MLCRLERNFGFRKVEDIRLCQYANHFNGKAFKLGKIMVNKHHFRNDPGADRAMNICKMYKIYKENQ